MDDFDASLNRSPLDSTAPRAAAAAAAGDTLPCSRRYHGGAPLLGPHAAVASAGVAYT